MTSQRLKTEYKNEQGVTLLLAVLVLSAITAIVFSIGAIALNEIKTSSDLTKTEPVIKAVEGVGEDGLFKSLRNFSTYGTCGISSSTVTLGGATVSSCMNPYLDDPYVLTLAADASQSFYLVNPIDQNNDPGYVQISVQMTGGSTGSVYFCSFDLSSCGGATKVLDPNNATTWTSPVLDSTQKYQLSIVNGSGAEGTFIINSSPTGLPAGVTSIENTGTKQGVTRKLQLTAPQ